MPVGLRDAVEPLVLARPLRRLAILALPALEVPLVIPGKTHTYSPGLNGPLPQGKENIFLATRRPQLNQRAHFVDVDPLGDANGLLPVPRLLARQHLELIQVNAVLVPGRGLSRNRRRLLRRARILRRGGGEPLLPPDHPGDRQNNLEDTGEGWGFLNASLVCPSDISAD